jgi:hypothetical protein
VATRATRSAAKSAPKPRVREEARALYRKAILDAAEAVFAEKGVHVARVQDIAERVNDLVERFESKPEDPPGFKDQLIARVTRFLGYTDEHRAFFQVASEQGLLGPGNTSAEALGGKALPHKVMFEKAVEALVAEGIAKGHLVGDPDFLVLHLRHALKSVSLWRRERSDVSYEAAASMAVDAYLGGVGKKKKS